MHPIQGYCYNIDGLCESKEKCSCWGEGEESLKAKLDLHRAKLSAMGINWDIVADQLPKQKVEFWTKGGLTNDEEDERDDLPERAIDAYNPQ